jgi:putative flippase GtrA
MQIFYYQVKKGPFLMSTRKSENSSFWQQCRILLFSQRTRPIRFIITGGISACVQLGFLYVLTRYALNPNLANALAFLLSAQVNFLLSSLFTWGDRRPSKKRTLLQRWVTFHGSIVGTAVLNALVFAVAHQFLPTLIASASGILVAAFVNFFMMNKLIFRSKKEKTLTEVDVLEVPVVLNTPGEYVTKV